MIVKNSLLVALFSCLSFLSFSGLAAPVNVNSASVEMIAESLSGVGPAKASAIFEYCQKMTCSKPEDLLNVKGIGPKTLDKISSELLFNDK